jgi:hypothetical protein
VGGRRGGGQIGGRERREITTEGEREREYAGDRLDIEV